MSLLQHSALLHLFLTLNADQKALFTRYPILEFPFSVFDLIFIQNRPEAFKCRPRQFDIGLYVGLAMPGEAPLQR